MIPRARTRLLLAAVALGLVLGACGQVRTDADARFGDQNFKTAIALIELYRVRHGSYPESLAQLDFTGGWDALAISSVQYERLPDGYALGLVRGWVGKPPISYPAAFWSGLGIRRTNVGGLPAPNSK